MDNRNIYDLMILANELEFEELSEKLENHLIESKLLLLFLNPQSSLLENESALTSVLKRDDLQTKESEIWDYLIKWGITQNSTLPEKLEDWSDENIMTLKTTLQQCLPLIRYFHIPNSDIVYKIKPYKKILDKRLWNDLKLYLMLPNQPVESTILPP
ncbi:hypothetical protein Glove_640g13 [Diversispora epigaea]|uniref:BACK domain-containing protein n=1 Tax=Diversispora epigaea TaxID=1348612 RepID=A0A397G7X9_9GLOM|nr:hypothetical protein Glove_640g13 [Diversispora epigaea]